MLSILLASLLHISVHQAQPQPIDYHLKARGPQWVHAQAKTIEAARIAAIKQHQ